MLSEQRRRRALLRFALALLPRPHGGIGRKKSRFRCADSFQHESLQDLR